MPSTSEDDWWAEVAVAQAKERRLAEAKERERERIRQHTKKIAADTPPLTDRQRAELASLLRAWRKHG